MNTVTYIAKPRDSRCQWWSMILPSDPAALMSALDSRLPPNYIRKNADLELLDGTLIIDSEANHHRKNRGFDLRLIRANAETGDVAHLRPGMGTKQFIKSTDPDLMIGSGDVAAVIRCAIWLHRHGNTAENFSLLASK